MALSGQGDLTGSHNVTDASLATTKGVRFSTLMVEDNNYSNTFDLDTRLQAINGSYYTQAMLCTMSKNDKVYALRVNTADASGIK